MNQFKNIFSRLLFIGCFGWIFCLTKACLEFEILAEIKPYQKIHIPFDDERSIILTPYPFEKDENPEISGYYVKDKGGEKTCYKLGVSLISFVGSKDHQVHFVSSHPESSTETLIASLLKQNSAHYIHEIDPKFYEHVNEEVCIQAIHTYEPMDKLSLRKGPLLQVLLQYFSSSDFSNSTILAELNRLSRISHILVMINDKKQIMGSAVGKSGKVILWSLSASDPNEFHGLLNYLH